MKPARFFSLAFSILIFAFSILSYGAVPQMINYQGKITTPGGALVDTTVQMIFTIYDDSTGGNVLWTETQDSVVVQKGVFSVLLGSEGSIPDSAFTGEVRYLGVKVGADAEMSPRKVIASVAYAFRAGTADGGSGGGGGWVDDGNVIRLETDTDLVGIGTLNPTEKLEVAGTVFGKDTSGNFIAGIRGFGQVTHGAAVDAYGGYFSADSLGIGVRYGVKAISRCNSQPCNAYGISATAYNTSGPTYGGVFHANSSGKTVGVSASTYGDGSGTTHGVVGYGRNVSDGTTYGGWFYVYNNGTGKHYGVSAESYGSSDSSTYGHYGFAENTSSGDVYGGFFDVSSEGTGTKYGVYAQAPVSQGYAGYFSGNVSVTDSLDVAGTVKLTAFEMPTDAGTGKVLTSDGSGIGTWQSAPSTGGWADDGNVVRLATSSDSVGIGTSAPVAKLDVVGDVNINSVYRIGGNRVLSDSGSQNIMLGAGAGTGTTGSYGTFVGYNAGSGNSGERSTFVGTEAGSSNNTGSNNTYLGYRAGHLNTSGYRNVFIGNAAGRSNTSGNQNVFIGDEAGFTCSTGVGNVFIGWRAAYSENVSNKLYVANGQNDANVLIYGEFDNDILTVNGDLGIGTTSPLSPLRVTGKDNWRWDVGNGWGDFSIGDSGYGLCIGVAIAGGGAGTVRLWPNGGSERLRFGNPTNGDLVSILQDGKVGIGTTEPSALLHVHGGSDSDTSGGGYIVIGHTASTNISMDNNEIMARDNGGTSTLALNKDGGDVWICGEDGHVAIGTYYPTAKLDVNGSTGYDQLRMRTSYTPTRTSDTNGNVGDIAWDDSYIYIKTSAGWKRAALGTF